MSTRRRLALVAMVLSLSQCSSGVDTGSEEETILFRIQGTLTSALDASPAAGARVVLGRGGHFSAPVSVGEVQTDGSGRYLIEQSQSVLEGNCGGSQIWLTAHGDGFRWTSGPTLSCTDALQTISFALDLCELPPDQNEPCNSEPFLIF